MPPFKWVKESLNKVTEFANITVVSSASAKGFIEDWTSGGIAEYTFEIMGQENGTKNNS